MGERRGSTALPDDAAPQAPAHPRRPGRFVVIVGPDGVGKTTVARALIEQHDGPAAYFHFLPRIDGVLATAPDATPPPPPPKATGGALRVVGWMRLLRNTLRCWLGYVRTIRPALQSGCLVVGDRWMYGYLVQPDALRFSGPAGLASAVIRSLPRPDLIVNLAAPADVIQSRKSELTIAQIEQELQRWPELPLTCVKTIDATLRPDVIAKDVLVTLASGQHPFSVPCAARG
jgi:thymidylate kinase